MKMHGKEWKIRLEACAQDMEPAPEKKEAALAQIRLEAQQKELRYRPGWVEILKVQVLSVPASVWLWQGMFLLLLPFAEWYFGSRTKIRGWEIFPVLSVCMAFGAVVFVSELSRHVSSRMAELEQSCYFNLSQLWLMRVCCISGVDVLFVTALGIGSAQRYSVSWFAFAVYVLTPFFLANAAMFSFFTMSRNHNRFGCAAVVLASAAVFGMQAFCKWIYEAVWLPVWIFLLAAAVLFCAAQVTEIGKRMEGEGLCWS